MDMFWLNPNWEEEDRHLQGLSSAPFQRPFPPFELTPGVAIIRGPRQIGKSTWMKCLLSQALKEKKSCFYHSCETLPNHETLLELLKSQLDKEIIFLDEISFVEEWWRAIKYFTDLHHRKKIILTGSNSFELKKGMDLMPGRWMKGGGEHLLLPMGFFEWQEMRAQAKWKPLQKVEALKMYFRIGGFPSALIEAGEAGNIPVDSRKTYRRWLLGDLLKLNRNEVYLRELLGELVKTLGSSISLQTLATKTQMMSYHTAQDYISILEHCYALKTLYAYDPETDTYRFKKEKKFYFTDPMIYWVATEWAELAEDPSAEAKLAEMVAHEFLSRKVKRLGYFSDRNGEVDFIFQKNHYIEIKWSAVVKNLSKAYQKVISPHKQVWFQSNFFND